MEESPSTNFNKISFFTFVILLTSVLGIAYFMVEPMLAAIIFGAILALLVRPLYDGLQRKKFRKTFAALTCVLVLLALFAGPLTFFVSRAINEGVVFGQSVAENPDSLGNIEAAIRKIPGAAYVIGSSDFEARGRELLQRSGKALSTTLLSLIAHIPDIILNTVIALITCFVFLTDGHRLAQWFSDKIPLEQDVRKRLTRSFNETSVSVVWATIAAAAAQAVVITLGFIILGVPEAFLAGGATFIFSWVPLVGSTPVWIIASIALFIQHSIGKAVGMLLFGLLAIVADNIARPLVLRGRGDMHPVVSLIAIFGGIHLFGILGIFFGPILAAVLLALLETWPSVQRRFGQKGEIPN